MEALRPSDPQEIGSYRLIGRLGAGGMGQVFLGRSMGGRPVVVKVIAPGLSSDLDFRRRFALEVDAARRVGGFFTAQIVDADPEADPPYLVAAYVPGPSLQEAVASYGPLPVPTVRALGAGLAEGLAAIHACDLVHRDLKPANVILSDDGPRVIDFGIARSLEGASGMTAVGSVLGTPGFMSPEQARGDSYIGPASDVFSLGSVLAFAATGEGPYGGGSAPAVIYKIMSQEPDLSRVPPQLREVIAACQAKDAAARPSVAQLQQYFADVAASTDHWLPAEVSAMVAERVSWASGTVTNPHLKAAPTPTYAPPPAHTSPATLAATHVAPMHTPPPFGGGGYQQQPQTMPGYYQQQPPPPMPGQTASKRGPLMAVIAIGAAAVLALGGVGIYFATKKSDNGPGTSSSAQPVQGGSITAASVVGQWKGSYVCTQGPTSLQLSITQGSSGNAVQATFSFFSTAGNAVPLGSYAMTGSLDNNLLKLTGDHWIQQPPNYVMVGLEATVTSAHPSSLDGNVVTDAGSCTTFSVQRQG